MTHEWTGRVSASARSCRAGCSVRSCGPSMPRPGRGASMALAHHARRVRDVGAHRAPARARGLAPWLALLLCAVVYRQRSQVRPETLVAVLMSVQLLLLERWRSGDRRWLWALPALALVWANAHVSYWIGFAMTLLFALDHGWRERSAAAGLVAGDVRLRRRVALESVRLGRAVAAVRLPVAPEPRPAVSHDRRAAAGGLVAERVERTSHPGRRLAIARCSPRPPPGAGRRWNGGCCCSALGLGTQRFLGFLRAGRRAVRHARPVAAVRGDAGARARGRGRPPCRRRR